MKWVNGLSDEALDLLSKDKSDKGWEKWFAWYPVCVGYVGKGIEQRKQIVWLETVLRKVDLVGAVSGYISWKYKKVD